MAALLRAIESAGYRGEVVKRTVASRPRATWSIKELPPDLQELFAQAGTERKLVLIDVHGPG